MGILDNIEDMENVTSGAWKTGRAEYLAFCRQWLKTQKQEIQDRCQELMSDEEHIDSKHLHWLYLYMTPGKAQGRPGVAALEAGMSRQYGYILRLRYADLITAMFDDLEYSPAKIKTEVARMFRAKKTLFFQKDGEVISERTIEDNQAILKALELASRHQGMLKEKVEHEFPNGIPISTASLSDDDRALIKAHLETVKKSIVERELAKDTDPAK